MLSRHGGVLHQNVSFFSIDCILIKRKAIDCCQYPIFIITKSSKTFIFLLLCQSKHNVSVEWILGISWFYNAWKRFTPACMQSSKLPNARRAYSMPVTAKNHVAFPKIKSSATESPVTVSIASIVIKTLADCFIAAVSLIQSNLGSSKLMYSPA